MAKYMRCIEEVCGLAIKLGKVYKVKDTTETGGCELEGVYGIIHKCFLEDVTILDIDLQRVNNIVIGTLNYVSKDFKDTEELWISSEWWHISLSLYEDEISLTKEHKGLSDSIYFDSAQEAQDYIDKFTKIIDDINMSQEKRYKINCDKTYTEEEVKKMKEFGIDFVEVSKND